MTLTWTAERRRIVFLPETKAQQYPKTTYMILTGWWWFFFSYVGGSHGGVRALTHQFHSKQKPGDLLCRLRTIRQLEIIDIRTDVHKLRLDFDRKEVCGSRRAVVHSAHAYHRNNWNSIVWLYSRKMTNEARKWFSAIQVSYLK